MIYEKISNCFPILKFSETNLKDKNTIPSFGIYNLPNYQLNANFQNDQNVFKAVFQENPNFYLFGGKKK